MEQRTLGTQGLEVSALGLGCMGMSDFYGTAEERDEREAIATIDRAAELGITMLDTADMYGPFTNEHAGRQGAHRTSRPVRRGDQVRLRATGRRYRSPSTGAPSTCTARATPPCSASTSTSSTCTTSTALDRSVPIEETVGAMAELVEAGKVRFLGLSEAGPATIRRAHAVHPISAVQSEYSLFSRDVEEAVLPAMRELGIGFVAYSPLGPRHPDRGDERRLAGRSPTCAAPASPASPRATWTPTWRSPRASATSRPRRASPRRSSRSPGCSIADPTSSRSPGTKRRARLEENAAGSRHRARDRPTSPGSKPRSARKACAEIGTGTWRRSTADRARMVSAR